MDTSVKDYPVQGMGNLQYTATPDEFGGFDVSLIVNDVTNATISAIVANPAMLEATKNNLRDIKKYKPGKADRDYVIEAAPNLIEANLIRTQAEAAPKPVAPVIDLVDDIAPAASVEGDKTSIIKLGYRLKYSNCVSLESQVTIISG